MTARATFPEHAHRVHDYAHLIARWRRVARGAGLKLEAFARAGEFPCFYIQTGLASDRCLYISAGIHGDEPAATEGLLRWAERHLRQHARRPDAAPLLIFPCLNPWGLLNNQRGDARGHDLNRIFDRADYPPVRELKRLIRGQRFAAALHLHEDYDAGGIYLYEIHRRAPDWGQELLAAVAGIIPIDRRTQIDGRPFKGGVALRRANLDRIPLHPEAIYLYLGYTDHVLTFETPSEFSLERRVEAQVAVVTECVQRLR